MASTFDVSFGGKPQFLPCPLCGADLAFRDESRMLNICASCACDCVVTDELLVHTPLHVMAEWKHRWTHIAAKPLPHVSFVVPVRGIKKMHLEAHLAMLEPGSTVELVPEPENPHDQYAVKVMHPSGTLFGYLPKDVACRMQPADWNACVDEILSYQNKPTGIRLRLTPDKEPSWQTQPSS